MARKRGARWQGDVVVGTARHRKSFKTLAEAEAWEERLRKAADLGLDPNAAGAPETTLGGFMDQHFRYLWGDSKSADKMRLLADVVVRELGPSTQLSDIDDTMLMRYTVSLREAGKAPATVNRRRSLVMKLLAHATRLGVVSRPPFMQKLKEYSGRTRFLTDDEERKLLRAFEHFGFHEMARLTAFLLYTGARRGEALALTWRDLHLTAKPRPTVSFWVTKGDEPRTIPMPPKAAEAIERQREALPKTDPTDRVFTLDEGQVTSQWERIRHHLGYGEDPQFVLHMLRHSCASRLVQRGVDLRRVQRWMGHKALQTTLRYAHLAPNDLDLAAGVL